MVSKAPERDQAVTIRLSVAEKERLTQFAITRDLRVGQVVRQFVNERLATASAEEQHRLSRDGAH